MKVFSKFFVIGLFFLCAAAQAQTVVKVLSLTGNDGRPEYEDAVAAQFNSEHPDIVVKFERLGGEEFQEKVTDAAANQRGSRPFLQLGWRYSRGTGRRWGYKRYFRLA